MINSLLKFLRILFVIAIFFAASYFKLGFVNWIVFFIIITTIILYFLDKNRDSDTNKSLNNNNLLSEYGEEVKSKNFQFPVRLPNEWDKEKAYECIMQLHDSIKQELNDRFIGNEVVSISELLVSDPEMSNDKRKFLKIGFRTFRKTELNHFIFFKYLGKHIIGHYYLYFRGYYEWYDVAYFVITSPLHIYSWLFKWIGKKYSIIKTLSNRYSNSAFETIDLQSFYLASNNTIVYATKDVLREQGVLSDEVNAMLIQNVINNNTNITQTGDKSVYVGQNIGGIHQS